jgi:hypothetical protein
MVVHLTEEKLKELLSKAYDAGWYGVRELNESAVEEIFKQFRETNPESPESTVPPFIPPPSNLGDIAAAAGSGSGSGFGSSSWTNIDWHVVPSSAMRESTAIMQETTFSVPVRVLNADWLVADGNQQVNG